MHSSLGFRKYLSNTFWLIAERAVTIVLTLAVSVYVARHLGPEQFGILNYAISYVGLFAILASLGLDQITVREFVTAPDNRNRILSTVFTLKLLGALGVFAVIWVGLHLTPNDANLKRIVMIVASGLFFQAFNVVDFFFQSRVESRFSAISQMMQVGVASGIRVVLVLVNAPLFFYAIVICLEGVLLASGYIYFFRTRHGFRLPEFNFDTGFACRILKESWPLLLAGVVTSVYMKIDQLMIKEMMGSEAVGIYAAAVRLSEPWYFIPVLVLKSLFPAIIETRFGNPDTYKRRLQCLHDLLACTAFIISFSVFFLSGPIVNALYGTAYKAAGGVLAIHIWACLIVFPGNVTAHLIVMEKRQISSFILNTIGAVLNILLNLYLIPRMGINGAAWATLASFFLPIMLTGVFDRVVGRSVIMIFKAYVLPASVYRVKQMLSELHR